MKGRGPSRASTSSSRCASRARDTLGQGRRHAATAMRRLRHRQRAHERRARLRGAVPRARDDGADELHGGRHGDRVRTCGCRRRSHRRCSAAVARLLGIDPSKVTVHTTFLGGGFGRRGDDDFVTDAVEIAKAVGAPVQGDLVARRRHAARLLSPRECAAHRASSSTAREDRQWENRVAGPSDDGVLESPTEHLGDRDPPEMIPYAVPNRRTEFVYVAITRAARRVARGREHARTRSASSVHRRARGSS